jgi:SAM-dependent methyltransferase
MNLASEKKTKTLDVGCGFTKGVHHKRGQVGLDIIRGTCDVVGDAKNLPFRADVFEEVYLYAVLEHLDNPLKCLRESVRVAKNGARFKIVIPVETRGWVWYLKHMVFEFPVGVLDPAISMWRSIRWSRYRNEAPHKTILKPRHITASFLRTVKVEKWRSIHAWFKGRKGKLLRNLLGRVILTDIESVWYIEAIKVRT